jgi:hypothetical protein
MLRITTVVGESSIDALPLQEQEYVCWPLMGTKEFSLRASHCDEFDALIAEMKDLAIAEGIDDDDLIKDSDPASMSSEDDDDVSLPDMETALAIDNDLGSVNRERFNHSSARFEEFQATWQDPLEECNGPKKRVRFATDSEGKMLCHRYNNYTSISKNQKKRMWYQQKHFAQFRRCNMQEARTARKSVFGKDFHVLYESCTSFEKVRALTQKDVLAVSASIYRGNEFIIFYRLLHKERMAFIKKILTMQQQHSSCNLMTSDERAEQLSATSRSLAKKSRRLANLLGSGDAVVARKMISQDELEKILLYRFTNWTSLPLPLPRHSQTIDGSEGAMFEI